MKCPKNLEGQRRISISVPPRQRKPNFYSKDLGGGQSYLLRLSCERHNQRRTLNSSSASPNIEYLNPKQIQISNIKCPKLDSLTCYLTLFAQAFLTV